MSTAGATIVLAALSKERTRRRLLTSGVAASAVVAEVAPMNLRVNGRQQWRLKFDYHDYRNQPHRGSVYMDPDEATLWAEGDRGQVLFDPERPATAIWLGRTETHS